MEGRSAYMEHIHIVKTGITELDVDCVVNAANEGLWAGGGVCGAIFKEAGYDELTDACKKIGHCDTGSAVITPGFRLKAKYIIHAVGPQWQGGNQDEEQLLRKCYKTALLLAQDNGCKSIGFPLISSGIYGYPKKEAWQVALRAVADSLDSLVDMEVYFAVLDDSMLAVGQEIYHLMFDNTDDLLLASIDEKMLWKCIEMLCKIRKIEWNTPPSEGGVIHFAFPVYPEELWQIFNLMKPDIHFATNMEKQPRRIVPSEMSVKQINTRLTWIQMGERFCDGNIAAEVENGNLLKMLLRLDDLLKKQEKHHLPL